MSQIIDTIKFVNRHIRLQKDPSLLEDAKLLDLVIELLERKEEQDEATKAAFIESLKALNAPIRNNE